MGRRPKPTAVRELEGNPGKRPLNEDEPKPPPLDLSFDTPPLELSGDPRAEMEWIRLAPMLRRCRQITEADRASLVALCLEWSRYLTATAAVRLKGLLVDTKTGYQMMNPALPIATKALAGCLKLWGELGLTPSSRTRVVTDGPGPEGDAFSEFDDEAPATDATH